MLRVRYMISLYPGFSVTRYQEKTQIENIKLSYICYTLYACQTLEYESLTVQTMEDY